MKKANKFNWYPMNYFEIKSTLDTLGKMVHEKKSPEFIYLAVNDYCLRKYRLGDAPNFEISRNDLLSLLRCTPSGLLKLIESINSIGAERLFEVRSDLGTQEGLARDWLGTIYNPNLLKLLGIENTHYITLHNNKNTPDDFIEGIQLNESKGTRKKNKFESEIKSVIDYYNQVSGKSLGYGNKVTNKTISARLSEGHSLEDFYKVIDVFYVKWGNDPKMGTYFVPSTIFNGKFAERLLIDREVSPQEKAIKDSNASEMIFNFLNNSGAANV